MPDIIKNENVISPAVTVPGEHMTTRKIGNTTFLVSSRFKEGKEGDIVSTFAACFNMMPIRRTRHKARILDIDKLNNRQQRQYN